MRVGVKIKTTQVSVSFYLQFKRKRGAKRKTRRKRRRNEKCVLETFWSKINQDLLAFFLDVLLCVFTS